MSISVITNLASLAAQRHISQANTKFHRTLERVASGKRINNPGDDAAGLAISTSLEARIRSASQAERNARDAQSLIQVASGSMNEVSNIMVRLRELAIQSASDTVGDDERELINTEAEALIQEVDRIAQSTYYLGTPLLNGEGPDFEFQVGLDGTENDRISYSASDIDVQAGSLGIDGLDLSDQDSAFGALETLDEGIKNIHKPLSMLGAVHNRMDSTINTLQNYHENLSAAKSRIMDTDYARETAEVVRGQIQQQATTAVLAQANQLPRAALNLI